jgi:hypothetical protein
LKYFREVFGKGSLDSKNKCTVLKPWQAHSDMEIVCLPTSFIYLSIYWDWVWTQSFRLAKQVLYCLSHPFSPFCSGYFGDGGLRNYLPEIPPALYTWYVQNSYLIQPYTQSRSKIFAEWNYLDLT